MSSSSSAKYNNEKYKHLIPNENELGHFINNKFVKNLTNTKTFPVIQPNDESVICNVAAGGPQEVEAAVQAAHQAYQHGSEWRRMSIPQRRSLMLKLAQLWKENATELAQLEAYNNGTSINVHTFVVNDLEKEFHYYIGWMDKLGGRTAVNLSDNPQDYHVYTRTEPIGVCAAITPWNLPLWVTMVKVLPCLCMGNTIILKPAECTPLTALYLAKMIQKCGFPPGVFNVVNGYGAEAGAGLSIHPLVRKIAFTGSTAIGKQIMKSAADSNLKKVQLELGGKSPVIVFPDVNPVEAAKIATFAVFNNNGQICTAGSRTFVHEKIYDQFVKAAVDVVKSMKIGTQMDPENTMGPLINKTQFTKVLEFVNVGIQEGGKMEIGSNKPIRSKGYYVQPTIFTGLSHSTSRLAKEEVFGPLMVIFKFTDKEEVIKMANSSEYGLASGILTKDINVALELSERIQAGTVWVNHYHNTAANLEFGGYKQSGTGRENGKEGVKAWTTTKSVLIHKTNSSL
jgi:acyl-CoA reductase-like NAD-dependent aldehyde dehydrogenase